MRKAFLALLLIAVSLLFISLLYPLVNQQYFKKQPTSAYEWYRLGKEQDIKRDFKNSEKSLKKALELDQNLYKAMIELGVVYTMQGDFIKARPFFLKALPLVKDDKSNYEVVYFNLGMNYLYENEAENAWKYFEIASRAGRTLGPRLWSKDPTEPVSHVISGDKAKFYAMAKKYYSNYVRDRINRIHRIAVFRPALALKDCENYIADNPGSKYLPDMIANKAWALSRLKEYDKANEIIDSLNKPDLRDDLKRWSAYALYQNYFSAKHYDQAFKQADFLHNEYPGTYSGSWVKYQRALIYQSKQDIIAEKEALLGLLEDFQNPTGFERKSYWEGIKSRAEERLFLIYTIQGDYLNAYIVLANAYKSLNSLIGLIAIVLFISLAVFLFFIFCRTCFYKKTAEVLKSKFRLKYLWLFFIVLALLTPVLQLALFSLNYFTGNLLGKLRLDPYFLSLILAQVMVAYICVSTLKDKYQIDKDAMGFVSRGAKYNFGVSLIALTVMLIFAVGYSYLFEKVLKVSLEEPSAIVMAQEFVRHGGLMQKLLLYISIVVTGPISEELFFRVFLFIFLAQFTGKRTAVALSAIMFALSHGSMVYFPYYLLMALLLSLVYLRTKSIFPGIIAHALINLVSVLLLLNKVL